MPVSKHTKQGRMSSAEWLRQRNQAKEDKLAMEKQKELNELRDRAQEHINTLNKMNKKTITPKPTKKQGFFKRIFSKKI